MGLVSDTMRERCCCHVRKKPHSGYKHPLGRVSHIRSVPAALNQIDPVYRVPDHQKVVFSVDVPRLGVQPDPGEWPVDAAFV